MRSRRFSVALVAATSVALGLVSPVAAQAAEDQSSDTSQSSSSSDSTEGSSSSNAASADTKKPEAASPSKADTNTVDAACRAEIDRLKQEHKEAAENGTAGSSFMGPQELALGIINGYGSSGMPETPACAINEDGTTKVELPEWAKSAEMTDEAKEAFAWINMLVGVAGVLVQLVSMLAAINPAFLQDIVNAARNAGFH